MQELPNYKKASQMQKRKEKVLIHVFSGYLSHRVSNYVFDWLQIVLTNKSVKYKYNTLLLILPEGLFRIDLQYVYIIQLRLMI